MTPADISRLWIQCLMDHPTSAVGDFAKAVAEAEREACAKTCEDEAGTWGGDAAKGACMNCASEIRARKDGGT